MSKNEYIDLLSQDDKPSYMQLLQQQLQKSKITVLNNSRFEQQSNRKLLQQIKKMMNYKQDKIYTMYGPHHFQFFHMQWQFISQRLPYNFKDLIVEAVNKRMLNIIKDLQQQKLMIEQQNQINSFNYESQEKSVKVLILKGQSEQIKKKILQINSALQNIDGNNKQDQNEHSQSKGIFDHLYSQEKIKEVQAFLKKKKEEKQQRRKRLEQNRHKQEQLLLQKQKQIKQNQQKQFKLKKQQFMKKNLQLHKKREEEKAIREQRKQQYQKLIKSMNQKPKLFQLLQRNYQKKIQYEQMQRRHKMISDKKSISNLDSSKIKQHEKNYDQTSKLKDQQRKKRYEQFIEQHRNNPIRRHSSFQTSRPIDKDLQQKQKQKQKMQKRKRYQIIIKQKYKPKLDQQKKKEMQTLIEELELNSKKKLKKTKLQNGAIVYQQIKQCDARQIGISYLQLTKQMAAKAKQQRAVSSSVELQSKQINQKKNINYLEELRKNPKPRLRKLSFVDKPNMSFDQKISRVLVQADKLNQIAKQNEMKLKFGKFKTSQQILNCKEQIDQSYLDIAKMKLKLIKQQNK